MEGTWDVLGLEMEEESVPDLLWANGMGQRGFSRAQDKAPSQHTQSLAYLVFIVTAYLGLLMCLHCFLPLKSKFPADKDLSVIVIAGSPELSP